eukprot:6673010-Pyramimonas_sp.AAC.1
MSPFLSPPCDTNVAPQAQAEALWLELQLLVKGTAALEAEAGDLALQKHLLKTVGVEAYDLLLLFQV